MKHIDELLSADRGVLVRRDHPSDRPQLDYAVRRGLLRAALPGVYTAPDATVQVRVRAAAAFRPDGVISGAAAAALQWWPELAVPVVEVAVRHHLKRRYPGYTWEQRLVPADLIVERSAVLFACPALSVLDLIPALGGAVVDEAFRRHAVTLPQLWAALEQTSGRAGNGLRRAILDDSRDEPWSPPERTVHRLLRAAGITGWRTNYRVVVNGVGFVVDLVFLAARIVIEVDGWTYHNSRRSFIQDRWRYSRLAADGWTVLPIAASAIEDDPDDFVALVRDALRTSRLV